jgi:hypothetical protein
MSRCLRPVAAALVLAMLPILGFAQESAPAKTAKVSVSRRQFAERMARIKEGMPEKEVRAILGEPDDIRTENDAGGIRTNRTREIWCYGADGHRTFPTLGIVTIDKEGKAQYMCGQGSPPDEKMFAEAELRTLLRLLNKAPSTYSSEGYDPLKVIRIVNTLQPLGKEKALAAISEYLRVASWVADESGREGMFLVLRVLFDVPADPGHMPPMMVGAPTPGPPKGDDTLLPRFPIAIVDDVPFLLVRGYNLSGFPEQPESHVDYFRKHGRIRSKPLEPGGAPQKLLAKWTRKVGVLYEKDDDRELKLLVANQILNLIDTVHRREPDRRGVKFYPDDDAAIAPRWKAIEADVAKLEARWNRERNCFTFKDGTQLPERVDKQYRRHIWKLDGLGGEAEMVLERMDAKHVRLITSWSGKAETKRPAYTLTLFAVKDQERELRKLGSSAVSTSGGQEAYFQELHEIELAEGTAVRARLVVDQKERLSPIYEP